MGIFLKIPRRPMLCLLLAFLVSFPFLLYHREHALQHTINAFTDGEEFDIYGTLYKKEIKNGSVYLYFKNLYYSNGSIFGRMIAIYDSDCIPLYSKVHIKCTVYKFSVAENEGGFDENKFYYPSGIVLRGKNTKLLAYEMSKVSPFLEGLYCFKKQMMSCFDSFFSGEESGLMRAMCLGDKTLLDEDAKSLFRDAGLSHILAVSGLHISIVGMGLFKLLKKTGIGFGLSGVLSSVAVIIYGFVVGYSNSALRAVIMFLILMTGTVLGEAYDLFSSWMAAFILLLVWEPVLIYGSGFVFSFGAVFGVFAVANPLVREYENLCEKRFEKTKRFRKGMGYRKSFKEEVISSMIFSFGIQLFTLPIIAFYSYVIPIYVVGLNLLLIPLLGFLIGFGLMGALLHVTLGWIGWKSVIGSVMFMACHGILYLYEWASDISLNLPVARITVGKPSVIKMALYYGLLFVFLYHKKLFPFVRKQKRIRSAVIGAEKGYVFRLFVLFVGMIFMLSFHGKDHMGIYMLSVGQGDGICIVSEEGQVYMVDGGSTSKSNIGKYILQPFLSYHGISKVDCWMISHLDEDHISGLLEMLDDGFPIKCVVLTKGVSDSKEETAKSHYESICTLCEKNHTKIYYVSSGDSFGTKSLTFHCLWPYQNSDNAVTSGTNESSMVLKCSYGSFDFLLTGDIGSEQEEVLLQNAGKEYLSDIEVLKGAHHGSKYSNSEKWLQTLSPKLCIFSAGKNNSYGHPSGETIDRLESQNVFHKCTIECGEIMIFPDKSGAFNYTYFLENNP